MNVQRYIAAAVVLFIFAFIYESYVHGTLLMGLYSETPNVWRNFEEMKAYLPFNLVIMALITLWITYIFTRFYKDGGWKNGMRFGFYIGVLAGFQAAGAYFYLPISATLAWYWFLAYLIESVIGGLLIGAIYHR